MDQDRGARMALPIAIVALLLWPLSYAWIPLAGRNPDWVLTLVPIAEIGAIVLAVAAIWLGSRARPEAPGAASAVRGVRLGMLVVVLVVGGSLLAQAWFR
jgi:hypothetical protein